MEKILKIVHFICNLNDIFKEKIRSTEKSKEKAMKILSIANSIEGFRGKSFDDEDVIKYLTKSFDNLKEGLIKYSFFYVVLGTPFYALITHSLAWTAGLVGALIVLMLLIAILYEVLYVTDILRS